MCKSAGHWIVTTGIKNHDVGPAFALVPKDALDAVADIRTDKGLEELADFAALVSPGLPTS